MSPNGRILVVDDEASLRNTLTRILRQAGSEVTSAADGDEALRLLAGAPYDLVYLDIRLPGRDGLHVLRDIRQHDPQLPVILLTAYGSLHTALEALRLGATDYLLKPISPQALLARTRAALETQVIERRRRELREQIEQLQQELRALDAEFPQPDSANLPATPAQAAGERVLKRGSLTLDLHARRATLGAAPVVLPPATFDYLVVLARHAPDPVNYQTLVTEAQGYQVNPSEARELAKYHVHVLRQALESDPRQPRFVHNLRSLGYRLLVD